MRQRGAKEGRACGVARALPVDLHAIDTLVDFHTGEMSGARSRTVLLVEFMETHKVSPLWHVGLGGPCGSARKNKVPTRADLCYGVVDREIVATKCA